SASATGARSAARRLGARLVHFQVTAAQFLSVQACYRLGGFVVVGHFHKGTAASTASLSVHDQVDARHLSERLEQRAQFSFRGLKTHVAYKKILHSRLLDSAYS